jgi:hypothetical protein
MSEGKETTEIVSERCSVVYDSGVDGWTCVFTFSASISEEDNADSVAASHNSFTFSMMRAFATTGQIVERSDS